MAPSEFKLTWDRYYDTAFLFWSALTSLIVTFSIISYLMVKSFKKIWWKQLQFFYQCKSETKVTRLDEKPLNGVIKGLVTAYLVLIWIELILFFIFRVYLLMFGGNMFCWMADYPLVFHVFARLALAWMYLKRYVEN